MVRFTKLILPKNDEPLLGILKLNDLLGIESCRL